MQLDRQKLNLLLSLPDSALAQIVSDLAKEAGLSPEALGFDPSQIATLRTALSGATDHDLAEINRLLNEKKQG